jgi:3-oxoadipate enol-lactonase
MYWVDLATKLAAERLVVTWDYPYHGASSPASDPREITVPSLARHGQTLLEHLSLPRAVLAGHSMGVQVILEYFRLFPEEVSGLMMLAGPHQHTIGHLYGTGLGQYLLAFLELGARAQPAIAQTAWRLSTTPEVADPLGRLAGLIGDAAPRKMMSRYFKHLGSLELVPLLEMFRAGQQHSAEDLLEKIDVPVLILHGTHDVMTPLTLAEEMADRIPDSELVAIMGGAHTLPIENPELIYREVREFLHSRVDLGS